MENERPIEKLLRRYAKKRRDEAGAPSELHPATRRLLQGEVARQFKKERHEKLDSSEAPARWWPRLIYGLCVVAAVGLLSAVFLPAKSKSKSGSMEMASADDKRKIDTAGTTLAREDSDQITVTREVPRIEAPTTLAPERLKFAGSADRLEAMTTNGAVLALKVAPRPGGSTSLGLGIEGTAPVPVAPAISDAMAAAPLTTPPPALDKENTRLPVAEGGYAIAAKSALADTGVSSPGGSQFKSVNEARRYSNVDTQSATLFSNTGKVGYNTAVLASFQIEQAGDELRVIDSDGSTYNGNFVAAVDQSQAEKDLSKKAEEKSPARQLAAVAAANSPSEQNLSVQNSFFRVTGTNKTLKQQVVFTGNIVTMTNVFQSQRFGDSSVNQVQTFTGQQLYPLQLNNSVIVGRAQLERSMEVEVNAVPVLQK